MSTSFLLHDFQTQLVYNICHCSISCVSSFNPGTSAPSHSTKDEPCDLYTPHHLPAPVHIRTSWPSHSHWYMWFIVQFVYEPSSLPVKSFKHFPAICLHELACTLWLFRDFVPAPQQVINDLPALWSLHDFVLARHSRLCSDQWLPPLTALNQLHRQRSSPPHWSIDTFVCVLLIVCTFHYPQHSKCNVNNILYM